MSVRVLALVWQSSQCELGDLLVLLAIADFADDHGLAYPSLPSLSQKARLSERQVQRALKRIEQKRELVIQCGAGPQGRNLYQVACQQQAIPLSTRVSTGGRQIVGGDKLSGVVKPYTQAIDAAIVSNPPSVGGDNLSGVTFAVPPQTPPSPNRQKKDPPAMPPKKGGRVGSEAHWTEFQESYPHRLGKALDLATTKKRFLRLSLSDQALLASAARNYAEALALQGLKAKDATRFLRTRSGAEPWRDWIEPAPGAVPRCAWTVDLQGTRCETLVDAQQTTTSYKLCPKHLAIRLEVDRKAAGPSPASTMLVSEAAKVG